MTNFTEDECSEHNRLLQLQKKILVIQRTLDKFRELSLNLNKQEGKKDSSNDGVSHETYEDGYKDEYQDENGESVYESFSDEDGQFDEFEGDEDTRACFPCPFCYVEIEIHSLCNHLQEEHCFDLKNAVCPLCAANLGKDVIGHFKVQHASSLKRRRKSQKSGIWPGSGSPSKLGRELSSFIGSPAGGRGNNAHESAADHPVLNTNDVQRDKCSHNLATVASNSKRIEPTLTDKDHEQNTEEKRKRAAFAQELVLSIIF